MDGTGWQPDTFGLHEFRYYSAGGAPTKLVRDRGVESYDEPPPNNARDIPHYTSRPVDHFLAEEEASRTEVTRGELTVAICVGIGVLVAIALIVGAFIAPRGTGKAVGGVLIGVVFVTGFVWLGIRSDSRNKSLDSKVCPRCGEVGFKPAKGYGGMAVAGIFAPTGTHNKCRHCGFRMTGRT